MKKSEFIKLVLMAAVITSCNNQQGKSDKRIFMRSDTTARYTHVHPGYYGGYYAFRPYGLFMNRGYARTGYFSSAIHESSNIGSNTFKGNVVRGGFGSSVFHVSS